MKAKEKAYHVWHEGMIGFGLEIANSIEETEVVYAKNSSTAKSKAKDWMDWEIDGREPTYIDLKCRRAKNMDIVVFEGNPVKRFLIEFIRWERKRKAKLESFLTDTELTHCYIMKRGTYYRPKSCGYTSIKANAGIYTIKEGVEDAISCSELYLERITPKEHNEMLLKTIDDIQTRLIPIN